MKDLIDPDFINLYDRYITKKPYEIDLKKNNLETV